jgi:hypothetical protein
MADEVWHPMRRLEDAMNRLADMDAGWWPFLHLRPARSEDMDNRCLAAMAAHYGVPFGLLVFWNRRARRIQREGRRRGAAAVAEQLSLQSHSRKFSTLDRAESR